MIGSVRWYRVELGAVQDGRRIAHRVEQPERCPSCRPRRARTIAISGTMPEPPATSSTGSVLASVPDEPAAERPAQLDRVADRSTCARYGDTSPSGNRSTVSSTSAPSGAEAIEYDRCVV